MYIRIWEWEELLELDGVEIFAPLRSLNMSKCGQTRCCWLFFYVFDIIVWIDMHLLYVVVSTCIHTSILRSYDDDCASLKACQKLLQDGSRIHHSAVMFLYGYVSYKLCMFIWNVCHQIMQLGPYHTLKLHIYVISLACNEDMQDEILEARLTSPSKGFLERSNDQSVPMQGSHNGSIIGIPLNLDLVWSSLLLKGIFNCTAIRAIQKRCIHGSSAHF